MQILDKTQIANLLGEYGMWSGNAGNALISEVKYLGGSPSLDSLIENKKIDSSGTNGISFSMRPRGLEVSLISGFSTFRIGLLDKGINFWAFEPQNRLTEKKSKSVVGRALIGGLLLGPVGAIVGGMTGIGNKETSKSYNGIENILSISYTTENNDDYLLVFGCLDKKSKKVLEFFKKNFPTRLKEEEEEEDTNDEKLFKVSTTDELTKLKTLLDEGLLSREEFDIEKHKILNR